MGSQPQTQVRVFMLGRFAVERDGRTIPQTAWRRKRPIELLTAVALSSGHVLHREEIIDRLWPDKDLDAGANNLYRTLHDLRAIVGDHVVSLERGAVRLTDDVWTDVAAFEAAAAAGDPESLATAVALYEGELLPDDPYSDVLGTRREFLKQRFVDVALRLARAEQDGDPDRKIDTLRRLLVAEPTLALNPRHPSGSGRGTGPGRSVSYLGLRNAAEPSEGDCHGHELPDRIRHEAATRRGLGALRPCRQLAGRGFSLQPRAGLCGRDAGI